MSYHQLSNFFTDDECTFVDAVYRHPGVKIDNPYGKTSSDEEEGPLWKHPEELGLIQVVGTYRWIPTEKLELGVNVPCTS